MSAMRNAALRKGFGRWQARFGERNSQGPCSSGLESGSVQPRKLRQSNQMAHVKNSAHKNRAEWCGGWELNPQVLADNGV